MNGPVNKDNLQDIIEAFCKAYGVNIGVQYYVDTKHTMFSNGDKTWHVTETYLSQITEKDFVNALHEIFMKGKLAIKEPTKELNPVEEWTNEWQRKLEEV